MAYPTELIRRARENRRMKKPPVRSEGAQEAAQQPGTERAPWQSRHASYDKLMRSHDRMHSRHLDG